MQTYIWKDGQQQGPHTPEELDQLLQEGSLTGEDLFWQEGREGWSPLSQFPGYVPPPSAPPPPPPQAPAPPSQSQPAATLVPPQTLPHTDALGIALLVIPFLGVLLIWLSITPLLSEAATIVVTSILVFLDGKNLGIGSASDLTKKGKKRNGPGEWFAFTLLLWLIGYPTYLFIRSRRGARNLGFPAIIAAIIFLVSLQHGSQPKNLLATFGQEPDKSESSSKEQSAVTPESTTSGQEPDKSGQTIVAPEPETKNQAGSGSQNIGSIEDARKFLIGPWAYTGQQMIIHIHVGLGVPDRQLTFWERWIFREDGKVEKSHVPPTADSWGTPTILDYTVSTAKYSNTGERYYFPQFDDTATGGDGLITGIILEDGGLRGMGKGFLSSDDDYDVEFERGGSNPFSK